MKQEELFLTIEQCNHLQKLGLDMSDAKFCWMNYDKPLINLIEDCMGAQSTGFVIPTYTLQEILNKLPKSIEVKSDYGEDEMAYLRIDWSEDAIWYECDDYASYNGQLHNLLEGAYEMLCWVLENNYLNNKTDEIN